MTLRAFIGAVVIIVTCGAAAADCPTSDTAARGYRLTEPNGDWVEITKIDGFTTYWRAVSADGTIVDASGRGGIFTSVSKSGKTKTTFEYQKDVTSFLPWRIGETFTTKVLEKSTPGKAVTFIMTVKVTGESTLSIDACHYRVLIIDRTFDGGSINRTFLAPDLMFPIKLQSQVDGAFRTDTEYSAIDRSVVPAPQ